VMGPIRSGENMVVFDHDLKVVKSVEIGYTMQHSGTSFVNGDKLFLSGAVHIGANILDAESHIVQLS